MSGTGIGFDIQAFPYGGNQTLADILLKLAQNLKGLRYSKATGDGSSTTLVDAYMDEPDDYFNGGTIFFLSGVLAGKTSVVVDWDEDTHTFTFHDTDEAPLMDVSYAVFDANYKRDALIAAVNQALSELSPFPTITEDETFMTVANQEGYELPTGVSNVKQVHIATSTTSPYNYVENFGWYVNGGVLYFDLDIPATSGFIIKLFHEEAHDYVSNDDDPIMDCIHPDLLAWTAAVNALITRTGISENSEPHTKEMLQYAQGMARVMKATNPIKHWRKASRQSGW